MHKKFNKINKFIREIYPENNSKIFMINCGFMMNTLFKIISVFLSEKQKKRVIILNEKYLDELLKEIDLDQLPEFLGGTCQIDIGASHPNNIWDSELFESYDKKILN